MTSSIDTTQPPAGSATTLAVRNNFAAAKSEIEALQALTESLPSGGFRATYGSTQSNLIITSYNQDTPLFDNVDFPADAFHSPTTNPELFTVPADAGGIYIAVLAFTVYGAKAGEISVYSEKPGIEGRGRICTITGQQENRPLQIVVPILWNMAAGDSLRWYLYNDSLGDMTIWGGECESFMIKLA